MALPFVLCENYINSFASLIMAFCSILTLVIAILLYDKYGVERSVKEKNFAAVNDLMEDLLKIRLMISTKYITLFNITFQSDYKNRLNGLSPEQMSSQIFFTENSLSNLADLFYKASTNLYLPPEIVEAIKKMPLAVFSQVDGKDLNEVTYWVVEIQGKPSVDKSHLLTPKPMTSLVVFLDILEGIKESCLKWLSDNSGEGNVNHTMY